jgi:hypothetical protein
MTSEPHDPSKPDNGGDPSAQKPAEDAPLFTLFRAFRRFLVPFLLSWALAYVGSARGVEWLYYAGLGGVTLSLVVLLVWLIS